jgi:hypothetical protein
MGFSRSSWLLADHTYLERVAVEKNGSFSRLVEDNMGAAPMALPHDGDSNPALPGWADGLADGPPGLDGIWVGA